MQVEFPAPEYQADATFQTAEYRFEGSPESGWVILRNGRFHLELGPGYRMLKTLKCGICSTDLVRQFLPFPLPQIIGHEVLAEDESGRVHIVEINASHHARGLETDCPFCNQGLHTHCPDRIVLGIHDLPGGFGPTILAPVNAVIPLPDLVPVHAAVLVEPLAAALNAVTTISPGKGDCIAVLGPRRLGLLVIAALHAHRASTGIDFKILALGRRPEQVAMARTFGADMGLEVDGTGGDLPSGLADVVIDTTGNPDAMALAIRLALREVHVKSTHGQPAAGLTHLTELVVDEIGICRLPRGGTPDPARLHQCGLTHVGPHPPTVAWLVDRKPPAWLTSTTTLLRGTAASILQALEQTPSADSSRRALPRADVAVVRDEAQVDQAIRPFEGSEKSVVRPCGKILLDPGASRRGAGLLGDSILNRGLLVSSSRCGDFHAALELFSRDPELHRLGDNLITHTFPASSMTEAFDTARSPACIKAVVEQEGTT